MSKLVGGYKLVLIYGLKIWMKIEDQTLLITSLVKSHSNNNMKAIQDKVLVCLNHSHDRKVFRVGAQDYKIQALENLDYKGDRI